MGGGGGGISFLFGKVSPRERHGTGGVKPSVCVCASSGRRRRSKKSFVGKKEASDVNDVMEYQSVRIS